MLSAVTDAGYTIPTPIQAGAIPFALERRDICGIAQTGTGKTASFVLPMLSLLEKGRARARMPRTLILEPTRELAAQVAENFEKYGKNHRLNVALLIGGVSFEDQDRKLERGADVLICTPGRLLDHFERGKLLMSGVEILVIDEADRMLDMGFIPDIERIAKLIPFTRQTLFFSATMPPEIQKLADRFLQNPERIEVAKPASAAKTVTQRFVASHSKDYEKRAVLRELVRAQTELKNAIIFCNRKKDVADLFRSLERHGFSVGALHGDMDQRSRTTMLQNFRDGNLQLLVASDVAARGLDIPDVSHVFNFDVPIHSEDYVHRIGRTGRAGRSGAAFTLVTKRDTKFVDAIEKLIGENVEWLNGDLNSLPPAEEGKDSDRPRRNGRERGDKDRGRGRGRHSAASHKSDNDIQDNDVQVIAAAPAKAEVVKNERKAEQKPQNNARNNRPYPANDDSRDRRRHRDHDDGPTPVGFGDDIPAFMLIAGSAKV
ncbi:DEAD/DEAH box type DNA/RNA helicase protein [Rhizobium sp. N6212]|nr:DEAD/DEAH box type DNA/RNA helicase protein [Rhizobium sp. N6212]ANK97856.1 DEAD/DEAH box type DNA/RNA helicase protein [Rhizobium sp. N621]ANL03935.1 DEAD/DEAH box type DNA/RNA helicase protein [Rhizobium esperanzae]ANL09981.1 DEAD/DEAH box type DNA/RNA helicase protein [Rhizobium sp. N1341]ANM34784.1 DEAD/DEAH box type DNA/RNA helicase protein [Rhizobium sp. N871]ANM40823.1 DEAD/DEAH box type DNA/RNA helicase protein [Rhizobium sp. N741]